MSREFKKRNKDQHHSQPFQKLSRRQPGPDKDRRKGQDGQRHSQPGAPVKSIKKTGCADPYREQVKQFSGDA